MNDEAIVDLFLARDEAAISETSKKYGVRLKRLALGLGCAEPEAEECENDVYLKAWGLIPPNEPRGFLFAFLARLMRAAAITRLRRDSAQKRSAAFTELTHELEEILPASASVESEAEANELGRLINAFLAAEPREKRALFLRRYWYCESVTELSKHFGFTKSKVKTELFRIRKRLAAYLESEGYKV